MRRIAVGLIISLAFGGSAIAEERAPVFKPHCEKIAKFKEGMRDVHFTPLTIGQFHFAEGLYVGSPVTPEGEPPGNGALLMEVDGHGALLWTRGAEACVTVIATGQGHGVYMPMPLSDGQLAVLKAVHTGRLEEKPVAPPDGHVKGELSL